MADTVLTELKIHEFDSVEQMSQYESEIGENDMVYTPDTSIRLPILTPMWFDHQVNDESWLNADTFSWQSGDVYKTAYEHLANDINGKTLQSEAVDNITVQFYLADDGHKICPASEESNIIALYEATGVAWYYILDTANKQFKLPRTKWGFTGLRDSVGGYVEPALPNITGGTTTQSVFNNSRDQAGTNGAITTKLNATETLASGGGKQGLYSIEFDASLSNSTYQNGATVQPPATQMRLYFWVGTFDQTATEQTAGLNAETFNKKIDLPANKSQADVDFVIASQLPTEANGYIWYRKYKSGWVEQGGFLQATATTDFNTITLPYPMADANYNAIVTNISPYGAGTASSHAYVMAKAGVTYNKTATSFAIFSQDGGGGSKYDWVVFGMGQD